MINQNISDSNGFAGLSSNSAVLFMMMIPHYNSYGKMNGGSGYIKDIICPKIIYLTLKNIPRCLEEISHKTNVKWFEIDKRHWIHSVNFLTQHQVLNKSRLGQDLLPTYSGLTPDQVRPEVEVEVEGKEEVEVEVSERQQVSSNSSGVLDPQLLKILEECPYMELLSTGESSDFWDKVLSICEPYPLADSRWLNTKIRAWDQWFQSNQSRRSKKREILETRIMKWLIKDIENLARQKS